MRAILGLQETESGGFWRSGSGEDRLFLAGDEVLRQLKETPVLHPWELRQSGTCLLSSALFLGSQVSEEYHTQAGSLCSALSLPRAPSSQWHQHNLFAATNSATPHWTRYERFSHLLFLCRRVVPQSPHPPVGKHTNT